MARILVVDDDTLVRDTIKTMLEHHGHEVLTAENGRHALEVLEKTSVSLVILDILMPEVEGIETIIRMKKSWPAVPIVAVSGGSLTGSDYLSIASKFGAAGVLKKPFLYEDIVKVVDGVLDAPRP